MCWVCVSILLVRLEYRVAKCLEELPLEVIYVQCVLGPVQSVLDCWLIETEFADVKDAARTVDRLDYRRSVVVRVCISFVMW